MELTSTAAAARYAALRHAGRLLVGLDFDGTLSPIVPDPSTAAAHPGVADALADLAGHVRAIAIVTGRPAAQVLELAALEDLADRVPANRLLVLGQYGSERWTSADRRVVSPPPPPGLADFRATLPALLAELDLEPWIEEKGLAVAVHTRRMDDPAGAFDVLRPALAEAAARHGLVVEPGRFVVEVRAPGSDKGAAVRTLVDELSPGGVVFIGDDLGDLAAFETIGDLRDHGLPGLLVCSGSTEQTALVALADVVVDGPDGVVAFLRDLAADLTTDRAG
jgi:trehalose 6-phosphate phosphatase